MVIYINLKNLLKIIDKRRLDSEGLRIKMRISRSHFSNVLKGRRGLSDMARKRMMKALPGASWDDVFKIREETLTSL